MKCSQCGFEMAFYRQDGSKKYGFEYHYSCPRCYFRAKTKSFRVLPKNEPEFNNVLEADAHNWDTREIV